MTDTQQQIAIICDNVKNLLLEKNKKYGDSALNPCRIFSKAETSEQLCVRIDDKLSRVAKGAGLLAADEDVLHDLIGYLVLLKIAINRNKANTEAHSSEDNTKQDKWDGSDIEPDLISWEQFWKTPVTTSGNGKPSKLDDTEWFDMYAAGDKFA